MSYDADVLRQVYDQWENGATWRDIAAQFGWRRGKTKHAIRAAKRQYRADAGNHDVTPAPRSDGRVVSHDSSAGASPFVPADERRAWLRNWLGTTRQHATMHLHVPRPTRTVVAVGDLHGYPDPVVWANVIMSNADEYVLAGDTTDQQYASSHPAESREQARQQQRVDTRQEFANVRAAIETLLDETAGRVWWFRGNHDQWTWRKSSERLPEPLLALFPDPLALIFYGLGPRVQPVGMPVAYSFPNGSDVETGHNNEFMYAMGDVLFSHLNYTSSMTESGVSKLYRKWFTEWRMTLGLDHVRMLVHFHVHARNLHSRAGGHMLLVEPGMGGSPTSEGYKHGYQGKWSPSVQGFVRFTQYQDDRTWHTDLGSVELVAPRLIAQEAVAA